MALAAGPVAEAAWGSPRPASGRPGRRVIALLLVAAAAADLARCGVVVADDRPAGLTAALVVAGVAAAGLSLRTARACASRRRWPAWAALLIGAASGPQAAVSGFQSPYTIPDAATAALGIMLAVAVLATAGRTAPASPWPDGAAVLATGPFSPADPASLVSPTDLIEPFPNGSGPDDGPRPGGQDQAPR